MVETKRALLAADDDGTTTQVDRYFVANVRQAREELEWSQNAVAQRMAGQGFKFHQTTIARIESGQRPVSLGEAEALARIFNTTVGRLSMEPRDGQVYRRLESSLHQAEIALEEIHAKLRWFPEAQSRLREALDNALERGIDPAAPMVTRAQEILAIQTYADLLDSFDKARAVDLERMEKRAETIKKRGKSLG